jgi:hypothetical protein
MFMNGDISTSNGNIIYWLAGFSLLLATIRMLLCVHIFDSYDCYTILPFSNSQTPLLMTACESLLKLTASIPLVDYTYVGMSM